MVGLAGGLGAAVGLLAGPVPPLAEPVTEPVDGLDQRRPLVRGGAGLLAAAVGAWSRVDAGGGDQHGQQEHDRVLEQGPGQGAGAGGAAEGEQDDHGGGQGDGAAGPAATGRGWGRRGRRRSRSRRRKPLTDRVGQSQRPTERAVCRGRGPGRPGAAPAGGRSQPGGGAGRQRVRCVSRAAPSRGGWGLAVGGASVHGRGPGSRRHTGAQGWAASQADRRRRPRGTTGSQ